MEYGVLAFVVMGDSAEWLIEFAFDTPRLIIICNQSKVQLQSIRYNWLCTVHNKNERTFLLFTESNSLQSKKVSSKSNESRSKSTMQLM